MKKLRRSLLLVVVAVAAMVAPTVPAAADPGSVAAEFVGSGTVSPGFTPADNLSQSVSLSGTMAGTFAAGTAVDTGALSCSFSGGVTPLAPGVGTLSLSGGCSGSGVLGHPISLTCTFTATITYPPLCITLVGLCVLTVGPLRVKADVVLRLCILVSPSLPTTSFQAMGELVGAGA